MNRHHNHPLWAQLCAAPGDLDAALVWADHLQAQGDPDGEAIALACAIDELPYYDGSRRELWNRYYRTPFQGVEQWSPNFATVRFRGLPFGARGPASAVLTSGVLGKRPIAMLEMRDVGAEQLAALANNAALSAIVDLRLELRADGDIDLRQLLESKYLGPLIRIELSNLREGSGRAIAACERLTSLRKLDVGGPLTDDDLAAIATKLRTISTLYVGRAQLSALGVKAILDGAWALTSLTLSEQALGDAGARVLADHPAATSLRVLHLWGAQTGTDGAAAITHSNRLTGLRNLSLADHWDPLERPSDLGIDGWEPVFDALALHDLTTLDLSHNPLRPDGTALLARSALAHVVELRLEHCSIGDRGLVELARAPLPALRSIELGDNGLTDVGIQSLAAAPWLPNVEELYLTNNSITHPGCDALARCELGALRRLHLSADTESLVAVLANPSLRELDWHSSKAEPLSVFLRSDVRPRQLWLYGEVTRRDLLQLAREPRAAALESIQIGQARGFDDAVAEAFCASPHLAHLGELLVSDAPPGVQAKLEAHYGHRFGPLRELSCWW